MLIDARACRCTYTRSNIHAHTRARACSSPPRGMVQQSRGYAVRVELSREESATEADWRQCRAFLWE